MNNDHDDDPLRVDTALTLRLCGALATLLGELELSPPTILHLVYHTPP